MHGENKKHDNDETEYVMNAKEENEPLKIAVESANEDGNGANTDHKTEEARLIDECAIINVVMKTKTTNRK